MPLATPAIYQSFAYRLGFGTTSLGVGFLEERELLPGEDQLKEKKHRFPLFPKSREARLDEIWFKEA